MNIKRTRIHFSMENPIRTRFNWIVSEEIKIKIKTQTKPKNPNLTLQSQFLEMLMGSLMLIPKRLEFLHNTILTSHLIKI